MACKSLPWIGLSLADCAAADFLKQKPAAEAMAVAAMSSADRCRAGNLRCRILPEDACNELRSVKGGNFPYPSASPSSVSRHCSRIIKKTLCSSSNSASVHEIDQAEESGNEENSTNSSATDEAKASAESGEVGDTTEGRRRRGRPSSTSASANIGASIRKTPKYRRKSLRQGDDSYAESEQLPPQIEKSVYGASSSWKQETADESAQSEGLVEAETRMRGRARTAASQAASVNGNAKSAKHRRKVVMDDQVGTSAGANEQLLVSSSSNEVNKDSSVSEEEDLSDNETEVTLKIKTFDIESDEDLQVSGFEGISRKGASAVEDRISGPVISSRSPRVSGDEKDLRFMFMEYLMDRVRKRDIAGAEQTMTEMAVVGLRPGPYAYHGLLVAYTRSGDADGALQVLRRELGSGVKPLPETFISLAKLFGAAGLGHRGLEILAAMEKTRLSPHRAWLVLVEELCNAGQLKEANEVFLTGSKGLKATQLICDLLVSGNCNAGDHANAINVMEVMDIHGVEATTYHYNYLLKAQTNADRPDIAATTLEDMQCGGDKMKPDIESYNWVIQGYTRNNVGDRVQDVVDVLGQMIEDPNQIQPNARTYALLVECYVKYSAVYEAVRHFRALSYIPGALHILHNGGKRGDPLSLYLRSLALEGRILELLQALELMEKENIPISSRAMLVNRKGRTLVSSWIEPLQEEADIGCEIDYVARFIEEGGLTGTRMRWIPSSGTRQASCDPDFEGFKFGPPTEMSFKEHRETMCRMYNVKRIEKLRREGLQALGGDATEDDVERVMEVLKQLAYVESLDRQRKPKAASKMLVSELKEELEAQGLPADGTRPVLYQRVQKARRINRARGRPLWVPPVEENLKVDERAVSLASRLTLKNDSAEYWQKRLLEDDISDIDKIFVKDDMGKISFGREFVAYDDEDEDEEAEVKDGSNEVLDEVGDDEVVEPSIQPESKEEIEEPDEEAMYELPGMEDEWKALTLEEKFAYLRERKYHVLGLKTLDEAWNWTWEKDIRTQEPEQWSQEREVELGMLIFKKVVCLGGTPTIGDCAMLVRASMRIPLPDAMVNIIQESHKLGHVFGSNLYSEAVTLCMSAGEKDAAIAIIADMEEAGKAASNDLLNQVLIES
ncbi:hypothetical protein O6H91_07G029100 [Diphasiastrum complanatum]|uniref:Uncharacterized protein n=1 Tax=Diphasiastrum complanatum TaxID=34168 RepID=A0ACC2D3K4_DIPCM|nr:hypothetical protein O6H91_07G029100 [Diphasiastrum complanatum]